MKSSDEQREDRFRRFQLAIRKLATSYAARPLPDPSHAPKPPRKPGMTFEEAREHKKRKHHRIREERMQAGVCTSCGRPRDLEGVTCSTCLRTDKAWRKTRRQREQTAQYVDDDCQPLVLRFTPRMLPIAGTRYDCRREDECLAELIRACGKQDAPGSSCPTGCKDLVPVSAEDEFLHLAASRLDVV